MDGLQALFERAATSVGEAGVPPPDAAELLSLLGYLDGDAMAARHRVSLLRAAARLRRLFRIEAPDAPGLCFFGGEAETPGAGSAIASFAGSGVDWRRAFESCVGEAIEYLSQIEASDTNRDVGSFVERAVLLDAPAERFIGALLDHCGVSRSRPIAWTHAARLHGGGEAPMPLDLCVRRIAEAQDFSPPLRLSVGCAAGVSATGATLHALLELVERDATAQWWRGGVRGHLVPLEWAASRDAALQIERLRGTASSRRTWLLDITTDLGVPVVAAVSARHDGYGFAAGFACRPTMAAAATAALFELCQMELGLHLAQSRLRENGESALGTGDRAHLRRAQAIDTSACRLLHPGPPTGLAHDDEGADGDEALLSRLVARLVAQGIESYAIDLTRPEFGVPVVRVIAPALQLDPCAIVSARLRDAMMRCRELGAETASVALF